MATQFKPIDKKRNSWKSCNNSECHVSEWMEGKIFDSTSSVILQFSKSQPINNRNVNTFLIQIRIKRKWIVCYGFLENNNNRTYLGIFYIHKGRQESFRHLDKGVIVHSHQIPREVLSIVFHLSRTKCCHCHSYWGLPYFTSDLFDSVSEFASN